MSGQKVLLTVVLRFEKNIGNSTIFFLLKKNALLSEIPHFEETLGIQYFEMIFIFCR